MPTLDEIRRAVEADLDPEWVKAHGDESWKAALAVLGELPDAGSTVDLAEKSAEERSDIARRAWDTRGRKEGGERPSTRNEYDKYEREQKNAPRPKAIFVKHMREAVPLILAGKVVEVKNARKVNTLIERLAEYAQKAIDKGEEAPDFNLCNITVKGVSFFCEGHLGIPRIKMPQLGGTPVPGSLASRLPKDDKGAVDAGPEFIEHLTRTGIRTKSESVPAAKLIASQNELVGAKIAKRAVKDKYKPKTIFISRDNYVVDGHHAWATQMARDAADGKLGDKDMPVIRIDAPITEILHRANTWSKRFGIKQKAASTKVPSAKKANDDLLWDAFTLDTDTDWSEVARKAWDTRGRKDEDESEDDEASKPTVSAKDVQTKLTPELAKVAQKVYDDWQVDPDRPEDDELCGGGICQNIAEEIAGKLGENGIEATTVSAQIGEQHVWVVAKLEDGVYSIDIPPSTYETGGGYSWRKIKDVEFTKDDIVVDRIDADPNRFEDYLDMAERFALATDRSEAAKRAWDTRGRKGEEPKAAGEEQPSTAAKPEKEPSNPKVARAIQSHKPATKEKQQWAERNET